MPTDGQRLSGRRNERGGDCSQAPWGARRKEVIADLESNPGSKAGDVASRSGSPSPCQLTSLELLAAAALTLPDRRVVIAGRVAVKPPKFPESDPP